MKRTRRTLARSVEAGMRSRLCAHAMQGDGSKSDHPATPDLFPAELEAAIDSAVAEFSDPHRTPAARGRTNTR